MSDANQFVASTVFTPTCRGALWLLPYVVYDVAYTAFAENTCLSMAHSSTPQADLVLRICVLLLYTTSQYQICKHHLYEKQI